MMAQHNRKYLKDNRKALRSNLTPAEAELWKYLKGGSMEGREFRQQHSVGNYILDFYCPSEYLAIELDGQVHYHAADEYIDREKDLYLNNLNIKVIRFENKDVFENLEAILQEIRSNFRN